MRETFTAEVPTAIAPPAASGGAAAPSFIDSIPTEYRDQPWVQDFAKSENGHHALAKAYVNAQSMIGKSTGLVVPGEDATPEARQAFHKALGVPDTVDGYEYKRPDLSKEPEPLQKYLQTSRDETFTKTMQAAAHAAGMTPKQFTAMAGALDSLSIEQAKAAIEANTGAANARAEAQLKSVKEIYGDQHENVTRIAKETLAKVLPENIRAIRDPEIALLAAAQYIHENLFKGDGIVKPGAAPGETIAELEAQKMELRSSKAFKDWQAHGHEEAVAKVSALYKRIEEMKRGAKD